MHNNHFLESSHNANTTDVHELVEQRKSPALIGIQHWILNSPQYWTFPVDAVQPVVNLEPAKEPNSKHLNFIHSNVYA